MSSSSSPPTSPPAEIRADFLAIVHKTLAAINGEKLVAEYLAKEGITPPPNLLAIGKAAASMAKGVPPCRALIVTKYHHTSPDMFRDWPDAQIIESGHPLPDKNSIRAGQAIKAFCATIGDEPVLCLLSGGASALAELPKPPHSFADIQKLTKQLIGSKVAIEVINTRRKEMSQLKGGGLAKMLLANDILALYLSDITNNDLSFIVSGLLIDPLNPHPCLTNRILADNRFALTTATDLAGQKYQPIPHRKFFTQAVETVSEDFFGLMSHQSGYVHLAGGEPLVDLPARPGRGGRNQHLALLMAKKIKGAAPACFLSIGTDGTDGVSEYAGGVVTNQTYEQMMRQGLDYDSFINKADSSTALKAVDAAIHTGPTGSNVMDLMIGYIAA